MRYSPVPVFAALCCVLPAISSAQQSRASVHPDALIHALTWSPAEDSKLVYHVMLPEAAIAAINQAVPGFVPRPAADFQPTYGDVKDANAELAPGALIRDLDGDGLRDAVLVGTVGPDRARSVIVGLRQGPRGFAARKIGQTEDYDVQQGWTDHVIALDSLTPAGRQPTAGQRVRKVLWVRYQELDCKGDGLISRVMAGAWVTKPSTCTYGE